MEDGCGVDSASPLRKEPTADGLQLTGESPLSRSLPLADWAADLNLGSVQAVQEGPQSFCQVEIRRIVLSDVIVKYPSLTKFGQPSCEGRCRI